MKRKVENTTYIKDTKTGAIVNSDNSAYRNARARRSKNKRDQMKITNLETELSNMKKQIANLIQLVKGSTNGN